MSGNDSEPEVEGLKEANKLAIAIKWAGVNNQTEEVIFHVKPDTSFEKIANKWALAAGKELKGYRFNYNGGKSLDLKVTTPKMLEMKVGRQYDVDAEYEQEGGSARV